MSRSRIFVATLILSVCASMIVQSRVRAAEFFDVPGADVTTAWAISPSGDVIGTGVSGPPNATVLHGYQRDRSGSVTAVDVTTAGPFAKNCTSARDISPSGSIVGFFQTLTCGGSQPEMRPGAHGFVRPRNGSLEVVDAGFPGTAGTIVVGTNPRGDLVGSYLDAGNRIHGFLRHDGSFTRIDVTGATLTTCRGINSKGEI